MRAIGCWIIGWAILISASSAAAQNLRLDYLRNVPRHYAPNDPWEVGVVLRNQMGHGGLFYNCDCEEEKRFSPYIDWNVQPRVCCPHGWCRTAHAQHQEIRQRVRVGRCQQEDFEICSCCRLCESYFNREIPFDKSWLASPAAAPAAESQYNSQASPMEIRLSARPTGRGLDR